MADNYRPNYGGYDNRGRQQQPRRYDRADDRPSVRDQDWWRTRQVRGERSGSPARRESRPRAHEDYRAPREDNYPRRDYHRRGDDYPPRADDRRSRPLPDEGHGSDRRQWSASSTPGSSQSRDSRSRPFTSRSPPGKRSPVVLSELGVGQLVWIDTEEACWAQEHKPEFQGPNAKSCQRPWGHPALVREVLSDGQIKVTGITSFKKQLLGQKWRKCSDRLRYRPFSKDCQGAQPMDLVNPDGYMPLQFAVRDQPLNQGSVLNTDDRWRLSAGALSWPNGVRDCALNEASLADLGWI